MREEWTEAKRIVIKIGSSILVDETRGEARARVVFAPAD